MTSTTGTTHGSTSRSTGIGLLFALLSAATFATSGPFAKSLLETGWTPGSVVLLRIGGAALLLAVPTLRALRGRWHVLAGRWHQVVVYGVTAVAVPQVAFFYAVEHLSVGVALMLEYLGMVLVVVWQAMVARRLPGTATVTGVLLALVGLALVLDLPSIGHGGVHVDGLGVLFGLVAACGLASFFLLSEVGDEEPLPPIVLAGGGLAAAAASFVVLGASGVLPMAFPASSITIAGTSLPWWVAVVELAVVAAATSYLSGIVAARLLGATVASFVGLSEVMFAVLFAWLLLGELPQRIQLVGGLFILAGVVAVRAEGRLGRRAGSADLGDAETRPLVVASPLGERAVVSHDDVERDRVDVTPRQHDVGPVGTTEAELPVALVRTS